MLKHKCFKKIPCPLAHVLVNVHNSRLFSYFEYQLLFIISILGILCAASRFVLCTMSCLVLFVAVELKAIALIIQKHHCSRSLATPTLSKKRDTIAPPGVLPLWRKLANNAISHVLARRSWPVSFGSRPVMIDYPPLNQFWIVFGNPYSLQYLRSVAN